jgi:ATP-dependent helicase YprA (DUF1998 family)
MALQEVESLESLQSRLRKMSARPHPELAKRVAGYRGGYSKEERRAIETELFSSLLQARKKERAVPYAFSYLM